MKSQKKYNPEKKSSKSKISKIVKKDNNKKGKNVTLNTEQFNNIKKITKNQIVNITITPNNRIYDRKKLAQKDGKNKRCTLRGVVEENK